MPRGTLVRVFMTFAARSPIELSSSDTAFFLRVATIVAPLSRKKSTGFV